MLTCLDPANHRTIYAPRKKTMTQQRLAILKFVDGYVKKHGFAPSDTEIRAAVGITSHSWARSQMFALQELGHIEYYGSRQVRMLCLPDSERKTANEV